MLFSYMKPTLSLSLHFLKHLRDSKHKTVLWLVAVKTKSICLKKNLNFLLALRIEKVYLSFVFMVMFMITETILY